MSAVTLNPNMLVSILSGPSLDEITGHLGRREPLAFRVTTRDGAEFEIVGTWGSAGHDTRSTAANNVHAWHLRLNVSQPDGSIISVGFNYQSDTRKGTAKVFPSQK